MAGGSQPGIYSCRDEQKNFVRASEQEESRATRKGHKKEDSRTFWKMLEMDLEVGRMGKDK